MDRFPHLTLLRLRLPQKTLDAEATAAALAERYGALLPPSETLPPLTRLVTIAWESALDANPWGKRTASPEHLWLFNLAGRLMGCLPEAERRDPELGERLAPLALVFVETLASLGESFSLEERIDWSDAEAVLLEFEEAWRKRRFPKGTPFVDDAVAFAAANPLGLEGNAHYVRLLHVAYYLQRMQPEAPILLPVSPPLAKRLGTSPVTLGSAVAKAVRAGVLTLVDGRYDPKAKRARTFRVDLAHPALGPRAGEPLAALRR